MPEWKGIWLPGCSNHQRSSWLHAKLEDEARRGDGWDGPDDVMARFDLDFKTIGSNKYCMKYVNY